MTGVTGVSPNALNVPVFDPTLSSQRTLRKPEEEVFSPVEQSEQSDASRNRNNERPAREQNRDVQQNDFQLYQRNGQSVESSSNSQETVSQSAINEESSSVIENDVETVSSSANSSLEDPDSTPNANSEATEQRQAQERAEQTAESRVEEVQQRQELQEIEQLKARDQEVRNHEQAHKAVGGQYAGEMSFTYTRGPDGVNYAVAGEVAIDASKVPNDPQATLEKAQQIRRAALAPAEPSTQDRRVAALASQMVLEAQSDIRQEARADAAENAEERSESQEISDQEDQITEASSASQTERDERAAEENQERLQNIFNTTNDFNNQLADLENVTRQQTVIGKNIDFVI